MYRPVCNPIIFLKPFRSLATTHHISVPKELSLEKSIPPRPQSSALYRADDLFSPVTDPDPEFDWNRIRSSLKFREWRGLTDDDLNTLINVQAEIVTLVSELQRLEQRRQEIASTFTSCEDLVAVRLKAWHVKEEIKEVKSMLRESRLKFWGPFLSLPNQLHENCPVGSEPRVIKCSTPNETEKCIPWSALSSNVHITPLGLYLTGQLAQLERDWISNFTNYWLSISGPSAYEVHLSDMVRGPAVEGCSWSSINQHILLEPTRSDLVAVPNPDKPDDVEYKVNPHTCSYLVGSASLAACTAYLMGLKLRTTVPKVRLICPGSVYELSSDYGQDTLRSPTPFTHTKQLSLLEMSSAKETYTNSIDHVVDQLYQFWITFQPSWPLRLVHVPAKHLRQCESFRAQIELITDRQPIKLASVSALDDWVSRRVSAMVETVDLENLQSTCTYTQMIFARVLDSVSILDAFHSTGQLSCITVNRSPPK